MKTPKNVAHIALWLALTATICVPGVILVRSQRKYATCYTLSLRPSRPHCSFATCTWAILRPHQSLSNFRQLSVHHNINEFQSHLPTIMMALPLRVLKYKSAMQSESRSLRAIWWRVKSAIGSPWATCSAKPWRLFWTGSKQMQRVGALAREYSRYGSAKGTSWAYWERIKSVWKRLWVPESSHLTGMWNSCMLIVLSIRAYILFIVALSRFHSHVTGMCNSCKLIVLLIGASILFIAYAIIALPLRRHWDCGAHDSFQGGIPMLSIASQCIHVTIPLLLDLFNPVTLPHCSRLSADPLRLF